MADHEIRITSLADNPAVLPVLAAWFHREWFDVEGRPLADIERQLRENLNRNDLPITFVAWDGHRAIGSVSLDRTDFPPMDHLSPWLGSFYVVPESRRRGIGALLLRHAERFARDHGVSRLHLWTPASPQFYERFGWIAQTKMNYRGHDVVIMYRELADV